LSDEQLFAVASSVPLLAWLGLCFAPLRRGAAIAFARFVAISLAVAYLLMLVEALTRTGGAAPDFTTLAGLARAFSDPRVMLIGWLHYLAFDLWVGSWEVEEAGRRGMPNLAVVPCLVLTLLAGPIGLLLFLALRARRGGQARVIPE
jgi:hypothetical protein